MKDTTPEQAVRAAVTTVMMHALLSRPQWARAGDLETTIPSDPSADDALIERAVSLADRVIAKVFP